MAAIENPDFIELDMSGPSTNVAPDASDERPLDMQPVAVDAVDALLASVDAMETAADFADIASESSANASVTSAGSLASGTMRIVGFSNAEGYITALAHGVKQATADSYKQSLRQWLTQPEIDALPVVIIPEATLPVGEGITHTPTGPSIFDRPRAQRAQAATPAQPVAPTVEPVLTTGMLIANLVKDGRGIVVSPGRADRRHTLRSATEINVALGARFVHLAPRIKSNRAQFGETMRTLNAGGTKSWAITRNDVKKAGQDWPLDLAARWCVGQLDGSDDLGSLGEKLLVADLLKTDEIRFTGGSDTLRRKVTDAFTQRIGERTFNATDMLNWFRATCREEFFALTWGGFMYVPGNAEQTASVRDFVACIRGLLGRSVAVGEVTSDAGLRTGLGEGLLDEVSEIQEDFDLAQDKARERDRAKCTRGLIQAGLDPASETALQQLELAARRAKVLPEAAGTFLRRIEDMTDRVKGYETMLGTDAVKPAQELLAVLRATVEPLCDDTSRMAANIELD